MFEVAAGNRRQAVTGQSGLGRLLVTAPNPVWRPNRVWAANRVWPSIVRTVLVALVLQAVVLPSLGGLSLTLPGTGQLFKVSSLLDGAKLNTATRQALAATGTNKTINFQGKVVNSNGLNVTNGSYTFQFKIYTVATGGTAIWTESKSLTVADGIFQTNLGDATSLPGSVDFNTDNIYLGITFNGDGEMTPRIQFTSAAYAFNSDKLGGLSASQFARTDANNTLTGTQTIKVDSSGALAIQNAAGTQTLLNFSSTGASAGALTVGSASTAGSFIVTGGNGFSATVNAPTLTANRTLSLPDAGGTLCTTATCAGGTANSYIQNGTTTQTSANFNVQSVAVGSVTGVIRALSGQTADLLQIQNSAGTTAWASFNSVGELSLKPANSATALTVKTADGTVTVLAVDTLNQRVTLGNNVWLAGTDSAGTGVVNGVKINANNELQVGTTLNVGGGIVLPADAGQVTLADLPITGASASGTAQSYTLRVGSSNALTVYGQSDGAGNAQNVRVAIGSSITPGYPLDVTGDINSSTGLRIGGTSICTSTGCTPAAGSANYIQNNTTLQTATFNIQSTNVANATARIVGIASQTADLLNVYTTDGTAQGLRIVASGEAYFTQRLSITSTSTGNLAAAVGSKLAVQSGSTTAISQVNRAFASQTADLLQLQASGGGVLGGFNASGQMYNQSGSYTGTLAQGTLTANQTYTLPNATGVVCLTTTCLSGATGDYIQNNQTATAQTANIFVQSAASGTIGAVVRGASGQSVSLLELQNSGGTVVSRIDSGGGLTASSAGIGGTTTTINANVTGSNSVLNVSNNGYFNSTLYASVASTNMVQGGFEPGIGTYAWGGTAAPVTVATNSTYFRTGSSSMAVTSTASVAANGGAKYVFPGMAANTSYTLNFYARTASGTLSNMVAGYSADGSAQTTCVTAQTFNAYWDRYSCTFTTPGSVAGNGIQYVFIGQSDAGVAKTYYIDDVQLLPSTNANRFATTTGAVQIGGVVTAPVLLQNANDSTAALQILNASGSSVLSVNTGTSVVNTGNLVAQSAATGAVALVGRGASGQTVDLLQLQNSASTSVFSVATSGYLASSSGGTFGDWVKAPSFYTDGIEKGSGNGTRITIQDSNALLFQSKNSATQVVAAFKGYNGSQTGDLLQLQSSGGGVLGGFNASGQLYGQSGSFTGTFAQGTLTASQTYTLPDATGIVCLSTNNCGYQAGGNYINNSTTQQAASFNIVSANAANIAALVQAASGQSVDILQVKTSGGVNALRVGNNGAVGVTGAVAGAIPLTITGAASQSANMLQLQSSTGTVLAAVDANGNIVSNVVRSTDTTTASTNSTGVTVRSGNATGTTSYSGNVTVDAGTGTSGGGNVYLGNNNAGSVNVGRAGAVTTIQGNSSTTTVITSGSFTNTVGYAAPTANVTTTFPAAGGTVCTNVASTCSSVYMAAGNYLLKNAADSSSTSTTGAVLSLTNTASSAAAGALSLTSAGAGSALNIVQSTSPGSGNALVLANLTAGTPSGNLIDLQTGGTSRFAVAAGGAVTSGTINGQTISSAANFTGTVTSASTISVTSGGIAVTGASSIAGKLTVSTGGADITGAVAVTGTLGTTGDITLDQTGSTNAAPRTLNFGTSAGTTGSRVALAQNDGLQTGYNNVVQLYGYNGVQIIGARGTNGAPAMQTRTATDPSLAVIGTTAASPVMTVQAAASQSGDLLRLTNNTGATVLAKFDSNGALSAPGVSSVNGYQINGAATAGTFLRGNGTNYVSSAIQAADVPSGSNYYIAKNAQDSSSAAITGNLLSLTNNTGTAGGVLSLTNSGTNAALSVTASTSPSSGQALILANNTAGTPTGNLIDLQANGTSRFAVAAAGGMTTGTINGQTISSAASFTGTVQTASTLTVAAGGITVTTGGINVTGVATLNSGVNVANGVTVSSGGASITGGLNNNAGGVTNAGAISGATGLTFTGNSTIDTAAANSLSIGTGNASGVAVGRTGGSLSLQGNASTTLASTSGGFTTTLGFQAPTANATYQLGAVTAGTYQLCSTYASTCGTTYASYYANGYVQLAPAVAQADATANTSIFINKTAGTSLVNLQASGSSVFAVQTNGNMTSTGLATLGNGVAIVDTGVFKVRVGSGTPTLAAATSNANAGLFVTGTAEFAGQIRIGDATNNVAVDATTREITLAGTARHSKKITLKAEYAGAILDTGGQTATTGTMTASFDAVARMSYYRWLSGQAAANSYDVLVQIPVPDDWSGWAGNPSFSTYATGTTGTALQAGQSVTIVSLTRTDGTNDTAFTGLNISPSALNTWTTTSGTALATSGYTSGGTMTLRVRLSALITNAAAVQLGDITLPYYSKY